MILLLSIFQYTLLLILRKPHGVCMKMFYKQNVLFLTIGVLSLGLAMPSQAQMLDNKASSEQKMEIQPNNITLNQEEKPPANDSNPPSLSDYLSKNSSIDVPKDPKALDTVEPFVPASNEARLESLSGPIESPEVSKTKEDKALRREAFDGVAQQMMPLKPSEIRRLLEMYDETAQAAETPIYPTPEPESSFQVISLDPGTKPLPIKTAIGNVTTLSIVDITGQPWPIQDLTWAGDFQIEQPDSGGHILRITPTSEFAAGNISMRLVGLNPPVIFSLKAERKSVHVRLDVQIPEVGPKGVLPPVDVPVSTKAGDDFMTSILVGVINGKDTKQLGIEGIDGRTTAYAQGGMMYIRTPYTMLSPAWAKSIQSGDGTKVYGLNFTPVVLLSDKGKMVRAYFSHKEQADEQY